MTLFILQNRHATRLALTLTGCRSTRYKQDVLKRFGATTLWKNVFFLGSKFSRHSEGLSSVYGFAVFRKVQISISQSTDFHFAKYRFSFRKVQIFISQSTDFISQSTDFHFAKYRFSFRKVQIFISQSTDFVSQSTDFHFAKYRFSFRKVQISFLFVSFRKVQ